jgi:hypothetical protein
MTNSMHRCMISIFLRDVDEIFAILGCYTACSVHSLPLYLLHGAVFIKNLTDSPLVKKFPAFYGTRESIAAYQSSSPALSRPNTSRCILSQNSEYVSSYNDCRLLFTGAVTVVARSKA